MHGCEVSINCQSKYISNQYVHPFLFHVQFSQTISFFPFYSNQLFNLIIFAYSWEYIRVTGRAYLSVLFLLGNFSLLLNQRQHKNPRLIPFFLYFQCSSLPYYIQSGNWLFCSTSEPHDKCILFVSTRLWVYFFSFLKNIVLLWWK